MLPSMPKRNSVILDINQDVAAAIMSIGDYVPMLDRQGVLSAYFSIVLAGILIDDNNSSVLDALDRLVSNTGLKSPRDATKMLSEMLAINNVFRESYILHDVIVEELEKLLPADPRSTLEELFHVEFAQDGTYLRVS